MLQKAYGNIKVLINLVIRFANVMLDLSGFYYGCHLMYL